MRWTDVRRGFVGAISFAALFQTALIAAAQQMAAVPLPAPGAVQPKFVVVLNAAHGGTDNGARLSSGLLEKNLVLELAGSLSSRLAAQGVQVISTRTADSNVSSLDRAQTSNHARAAACISLHATDTGSGVHLFTSSLAPAASASSFSPWQSAQSPYVMQSLRLSSEIDSALAHAAIPVTLGRTAIEPLDSFTCPAVAVEVAPIKGRGIMKAAPLTDAAYQKKVVDALMAALAQWRNDWRQLP